MHEIRKLWKGRWEEEGTRKGDIEGEIDEEGTKKEGEIREWKEGKRRTMEGEIKGRERKEEEMEKEGEIEGEEMEE